MIAERGRTPPADPPRDLFDVLVAARDPETGAGFTPTQLRDQIATLAVAGHETTALTMFWASYLLSLAPEVQELVAAEAAGVDLAPDGAAAAVDRLPLTRAVVQEALRLYPPAFTIVRMAQGADELAGQAVPEGQPGRHGALDPAPPPQALGPSRALRPDPLPARRPAGRPLRLPAVRRRPAGLHRRPVRADGGDAGPGPAGRGFRLEIVGPKRVTPVAVVTTVPDRVPVFRLVPR